MSATPSFEPQIRSAAPHVAEIVWSRPPNNHLDAELVRGIAEALEALDADPSCRAVVLAPEGKHFCGGANLAGRARSLDNDAAGELYRQALRMFRTAKPVVAAVQGAAIGGGLGLALAADFRVLSDDARLSANFSRLGYFPGFGLTVTLARLVGVQKASLLLYSGRRVPAQDALGMGLAEAIAARSELRSASIAFAAEIAGSAPLSVTAIRSRMRAGLAASVEAAIAFESAEQVRLRATKDFAEGVQASAERRPPSFTGS